jgi:hypothetical protein
VWQQSYEGNLGFTQVFQTGIRSEFYALIYAFAIVRTSPGTCERINSRSGSGARECASSSSRSSERFFVHSAKNNGTNAVEWSPARAPECCGMSEHCVL